MMSRYNRGFWPRWACQRRTPCKSELKSKYNRVWIDKQEKGKACAEVLCRKEHGKGVNMARIQNTKEEDTIWNWSGSKDWAIQSFWSPVKESGLYSRRIETTERFSNGVVQNRSEFWSNSLDYDVYDKGLKGQEGWGNQSEITAVIWQEKSQGFRRHMVG